MSQESRDVRLGLTGLTPQQRQQRLDEMDRELAQKEQAAERMLQERRAERYSVRGDAGEPDVPIQPPQ